MDEKLVIGSMSMEPQIRLICRYEYKEFFKYPNVVAVGLSNKVINNKKTDIECICVYVEEKINELPQEFQVPEFYKGIPTDVIESGKLYGGGTFRREMQLGSNGLGGFTQRMRPFRPGYGIGGFVPHMGTGCCLVVAEYKGQRVLCLLSSGHIIGGLNVQQPGDVMIQPAPDFGGTDKDVFGYVAYYQKIDFDLSHVNYTDTGIIKLTDGRDSLRSNDRVMTPEIAFMTKPRGTELVTLNEKIQRSGAGSGYQVGTVTTLNATVKLVYEGDKPAIFIDQILINLQPYYGDSGAPIVNMDNYIVGMQIGTGIGYSVASPINTALALVNAELII